MTNNHVNNRDKVQCLLDALSQSDRYVRIAAVEALKEKQDPTVLPAIVHTLNCDTDQGVRWVAAGAMGYIGDADAVTPLLKALRSRDDVLRDVAAQALVEIGKPALSGLLEALRDPDKAVRAAAAQALGQLKDPQAVSPLIDVTQDEDWSVRWGAIKALESIGTPEALSITQNWRTM